MKSLKLIGLFTQTWRLLKIQFFFVLCPLFFLLCNQASANDVIEDLLNLSLDELADYEVVAPTKSASRLSDAPGTVSVITYSQIRRSSARTIPELLRSIPGVNVRWNPMVQTIDIRSFGSNPFTSKVLLLIDGIPYNSWNKGGFPQHPGFDFFNLENVKHIEVIRGAGSALYGENALNGVINIVTLSGEEYRQTRVSAYIGERNTRSFSLSHGRKFAEDGSIFISGRVLQTQLPTAFWYEENDSDAKSYDFYMKAKYRDMQFSWYRLEDKFDGFEQEFSSPPFPTGSAFRSADSIEQDVNILALNYANTSEDGDWSLEANVSYASRDGSSCGSCHAAQQDSAFPGQKDHGSQMFANAQAVFRGIDHHEILLGIEHRDLDAGNNVIEFHDSVQVSGTGQADLVTSYSKESVFVQDQIKLFDNKLNVTAGVRFETATSPALFDSQVFPRIAAVMKVTDKMTLRATWNEAARYPSFTEIYQSSDFIALTSADGELTLGSFVANPELGPEFIESYELGLDHTVSSNLYCKINLFRNEVRDSIVIAYPRIRFENHPNDAVVEGIEVEFKASLNDRLSGYANWTYQSDKQKGNGLDSGGNPIEFSYSPKNKINFGATYETEKGVNVTLEANWVGERFAPGFWYPISNPQDPQVRPLEDYLYVNLRADFNSSLSWLGASDRVKLSLNARNLTDKRTTETLTGVDNTTSGREFFIGIEYDFSL